MFMSCWFRKTVGVSFPLYSQKMRLLCYSSPLLSALSLAGWQTQPCPPSRTLWMWSTSHGTPLTHTGWLWVSEYMYCIGVSICTCMLCCVCCVDALSVLISVWEWSDMCISVSVRASWWWCKDPGVAGTRGGAERDLDWAWAHLAR